jgi:hypothetical protein
VRVDCSVAIIAINPSGSNASTRIMNIFTPVAIRTGSRLIAGSVR